MTSSSLQWISNADSYCIIIGVIANIFYCNQFLSCIFICLSEIHGGLVWWSWWSCDGVAMVVLV